MYGIWNKQCHLHRFRRQLQLSSEVFCSVHCLQMVRRTLCELTVCSNLQVYDVKSVNINGHTFLAFAWYYSGSSHNTNSLIYKWDCTKFVLFQSIPSRGARAWYPFAIGGQTYLGLANYYDSSRNKAHSQLCTRPLEDSSSSTKRFPPMERLISHHLSTKVSLIWQ